MEVSGTLSCFMALVLASSVYSVMGSFLFPYFCSDTAECKAVDSNTLCATNCTCRQGYYRDNDNLPCQPNYGSSCLTTADCELRDPYTQCDGSGKCVCKVGYEQSTCHGSCQSSASCLTNWTQAGRYCVKTAGVDMTWVSATTWCKKEGIETFLATPLTENDRTALKAVLPAKEFLLGMRRSYRGKNSITILGHTYSIVTMNGAPLPWDATENLQSDFGCVALDNTGQGIVFKMLNCSLMYDSICWYPLGDNIFEEVPVGGHTLRSITDREKKHPLADCKALCLRDSKCLAFEFEENLLTNSCYTFRKSPLTDVLKPAEVISNSRIFFKACCTDLPPPVNGAFTGAVQNGVGQSRTYECNPLHKSVNGYMSDSVTCQDNPVRWSSAPICVRSEICPTGWHEFRHKCYKVVMGTDTWKEAQQLCWLQYSADLATIVDQEETDFVTSLIWPQNVNDSFWIGLNDRTLWGSLREGKYYFNNKSQTSVWQKGGVWHGYEDWANTPPWAVQPISENTHNYVMLRAWDGQHPPLDRHYWFTQVENTTANTICSMAKVNVGANGCNGEDKLCKSDAQCLGNVCICNDLTHHFEGTPGTIDAKCLRLFSVRQHGDCDFKDELCRGSSICLERTCFCPEDWKQSGPDANPATYCTKDPVECDSGWVGYNKRCYYLHESEETYGPLEGACHEYHGHVTSMHSLEELTLVFALAHFGRAYIGMHRHYDAQGYIWTDGTPVDYAKWGYYEEDEEKDCVIMTNFGEWTIERCTPQLGLKGVCVRAGSCSSPPLVLNATATPQLEYEHAEGTSSANGVHYHLGDWAKYICDEGFEISGLHTGWILCEEQESGSNWTDGPQCESILPSYSFNTNISASVEDKVASFTTEGLTYDVCCSKCSNHSACKGFTYQQEEEWSLPVCDLYSRYQFDISHCTDVVGLNIRTVCPPVPYVKHADYSASGREIGDHVNYTCHIRYELQNKTSRTIFCTEDATWNTVPICREKMEVKTKSKYTALPPTNTIYTEYYRVNLEECVELCLRNRSHDCVAVSWHFEEGNCYLHNITRLVAPPGKVIPDSAYTYASLIASDHRGFMNFTQAHLNWAADPVESFGNISQEECAHTCVVTHNFTCLSFDYYREKVSECLLYDVTKDDVDRNGIVLNILYNEPGWRHFELIQDCPAIPVVDGAVATGASRVIHSQVTYKCTEFGETLIGAHNDTITCLRTGVWEKPPVCRNLCEAGWYMFEGYCYQFLPATSHTNQIQTCATEGAFVTSIHSLAQAQFLDELMFVSGFNMTTWLGMVKISASPEMWVWLDGTDVDWTGWGTVVGSGDYPHTAGSFSHWKKLTSPDTQYLVTCSKPQPELDCPSGWYKFRGYCYTIPTEAQPFAAAAATCALTPGGKLASLHHHHELNKLKDIRDKSGKTNTDILIGLQDQTGMQVWKWIDGSAFDFQYWNETASQMAGRCVVVSGDHWQRTDCAQALHFLCMTPLDVGGVPVHLPNQKCSTDSFCGGSDMVCRTGSNTRPTCQNTKCPVDWFYHEDYCYKSLPGIEHFHLMGAKCIKEGGTIATIPTLDAHFFVLETIYKSASDFLWVGRDSYIDSSFQWMNYDIGGYVYLGYEPSGTEEVLMEGYRGYHSLYSSDSLSHVAAAVCQKPITKTVPRYEGCFKDSSTQRDLQAKAWTFSRMTVTKCTDYCADQGYKYAALQSGNKCYCDNIHGRYGRLVESSCNAACGGNTAEICGDTTASSIYLITNSLCSGTMRRYTDDAPQRCYHVPHFKLSWHSAREFCMRQGGDLAEVTSYGLQHMLNEQLMDAVNEGSTSNKIYWIGLTSVYFDNYQYKYNNQSFPIFNSWKYLSGGKKCVASYKSNGGAWKSMSCFTKFYFICQYLQQNIGGGYFYKNATFNSNAAGIKGKRYKGGTVAALGETFNMEAGHTTCVNDPQICPLGFSFMFWVRIKDILAISDKVIFASGDCAGTVTHGDGFCLIKDIGLNISLYHAKGLSNQRYQYLFEKSDSDVWIHLTLMYSASSGVALFKNGHIVSAYSATNLNRPYVADYAHVYKGIRFGASVMGNMSGALDIDEIHLYDRRLSPNELTSVREEGDMYRRDGWTTLHLNIEDGLLMHGSRLGPAIASQGISLLYSHSSLGIGDISSSCLSNSAMCSNGGGFTIGFWLSLHACNPSQDWLIFNTGGDSPVGSGVTFKLDHKLNKVMLVSRHKDYTCQVSVSIPCNEWIHLAYQDRVFSGSCSVYINGRYIQGAFFGSNGNNLTNDEYISATFGNRHCPLGWQEFAGHCYLFTNGTTLPFWAAEQICQSFGGHLLYIDNEQEKNFIEDTLPGSNYYMGVWNRDTSGENISYVRTDGSALIYELPWTTYTSTSQLFRCLLLKFSSQSNLEKYATKCSNDFDYICEIDSGNIPDESCPKDWISWRGHCYYIHAGSSLSYTDAVEACKNTDSTLVVIEDDNEQEMLADNIKIHGVHSSSVKHYIGVHDAGNGARTPSGQPVVYFKGSGPIPSQPLCVIMDCYQNDCDWVSAQCSSLQRYICEMPQKTSWEGFSVDEISYIDGLGDYKHILAGLVEPYYDMNASYTFTLDDIRGDIINGTLIHGNSEIDIRLLVSSPGNVQFIQDGIVGNALRLNQPSSLTYQPNTDYDKCIINVDQCPSGFTMAMWIFQETNSDMTYVDSGAAKGLHMKYVSSSQTLEVTVRDMFYTWKAEAYWPVKHWLYVVITWHYKYGVYVFINGHRMAVGDIRKVHNRNFGWTSLNGQLILGCPSCVGSFLIDRWKFQPNAWNPHKIRHEYVRARLVHISFDTWPLPGAQSSGTETLEWRNSFFNNALYVTNEDTDGGLKFDNNHIDCFTNIDQCVGPFTLSFWLRPLTMEANQTFMLSTAETNDQTYESMKIYYDVYDKSYIAQILKGRYILSREFWLELNEWSHIVIHVYVGNLNVIVYVNGQDTQGSTSLYFKESEPITAGMTSYLEVGIKGWYYLDDIRFFLGSVESNAIYVLRSCFEFSLADFKWNGEYLVDPDGLEGVNLNAEYVKCDMNTSHKEVYTVLTHNQQDIIHVINQNTESQTKQVTHEFIYGNHDQPYIQAIKLASSRCFQSVTFYCLNTELGESFSEWEDYDGYSGPYLPGYGNANYPCINNNLSDIRSCNIMDDRWRMIAENMTNMKSIPIKALHLNLTGITGGEKSQVHFDIGSLICTSETGYRLPLDKSDMSDNILPLDVNATVVHLNESSFIEEWEGIHEKAMRLNQAGILLDNWEDSTCMADIHECYFGLTITLWIYVQETNTESNDIYIFSSGAEDEYSRGMSVVCSDSGQTMVLVCTATVTYNSTKEVGSFNLLKERWTHLAVTWEKTLGLQVFVNGHTITLSITKHVLTTAASFIRNILTIGYSHGLNDTYGRLAVDDVRMFDYVIPEKEIRDDLRRYDFHIKGINLQRVFGEERKCDPGWEYYEGSQSCFKIIVESTNYSSAREQCNIRKGHLAYIEDNTTQDFLTNYMQTKGVTVDVYIGLKQFPDMPHPPRWLNGKLPLFTNWNNACIPEIYINTSCSNSSNGVSPEISNCTEYNETQVESFNSTDLFCNNASEGACAVLYYFRSWKWQYVDCSNNNPFICQKDANYVTKRQHHMKMDEITGTDPPRMVAVPAASLRRGEMGEAVRITSGQLIRGEFMKECIDNFERCHNGFTWNLFIIIINSISSRTVILNIGKSSSVAGLMLSAVPSNSGTVNGELDIRYKAKRLMYTFKLETWKLTWITVVVSPDMQATVYINGIENTFDTGTLTKGGNYAPENIDVPTKVTFGGDDNGLQAGNLQLDDIHFFEYQLFAEDILKLGGVQHWNLYNLDRITGNIHSLTPTGNTLPGLVDGIIGKCAYIDTSMDQVFVLSGDFMFNCFTDVSLCTRGHGISFWIKPQSLNTNAGIFSAGNRYFGVDIVYHQSHPSLGLNQKTWIIFYQGEYLYAYPVDIRIGVWNHVAMSIDNMTHTIWIDTFLQDGAAVVSLSNSPSVPYYPHGKVYLGAAYGLSTSLIKGFTGSIDEVLFTDYARYSTDSYNMFFNGSHADEMRWWRMKSIVSTDILEDEYGHSATTEGGPFIVNGFIESALHLDGRGQYIDLSQATASCPKDVRTCHHGFTVSLFMIFHGNNDLDQYIISSGGSDGTSSGFFLRFVSLNSTLPFRRHLHAAVVTDSRTWEVWFNVIQARWISLVMTWQQYIGLYIYVDDFLAGIDLNGTLHSVPGVRPTTNKLYIGRDVESGDTFANTTLDDIKIFDVVISGRKDMIEWTTWLQIHGKKITAHVVEEKTELSIEECKYQCRQNTRCVSLAFCPRDPVIPKCVLGSETSVSSPGDVVPSAECDYYEPLNPYLTDTYLGCAVGNISTIAGQGKIQNGNITADTCRQHCRTHHYGTHALLSQGDMCACALCPDNLQYTDDEFCQMPCLGNNNQICGGTEYSSVYLVTHVIPLLDVKESIVMFETDFTPGITLGDAAGMCSDLSYAPSYTGSRTWNSLSLELPVSEMDTPVVNLLINETMKIDIIVNEESYAGIHVNYNDGSDSYYTLKRSANKSYPTFGSYLLELMAINEINSIRKEVWIHVFEEIIDLILDETTVYPPREDVTLSINVTTGNNVTCRMDFGDSNYDEIVGIGYREMFTFIHNYADGGVKHINVSCYNARSRVSANKTIYVEDALEGIAVEVEELVHMGDNISVQWHLLSSGPFLSIKDRIYIVYINDTQVEQFTSDQKLGNISLSPDIYMSVGDLFIMIKVKDDMFGDFNNTDMSKVRESLDNITITSTSYHLPTHKVVNFDSVIGKGSHFYLTITYGDGGVSNHFIEDNITMYVTNQHTYTMPGFYIVCVTASNEFGTVSHHIEVVLENEVRDISLSIVNATSPIVSAYMTFRLGHSTPHPTSAMIRLSYGDRSAMILEGLSLMYNILNYDHQYAEDGYYIYNATIWNNVSSLEFNQVIKVGEEIRCFNMNVAEYVLIDKEAVYTVDVCQGSSINYEIHYGNNINEKVQNIGSHPNSEFKFRQSFDVVGIYYPVVRAWNMWSNVTASLVGGVKVQDAVRGIAISVSSPKQTGDVVDVVIYISHFGTNSCFIIDYGDNFTALYGEAFCLHKPKYSDMLSSNNSAYLPFAGNLKYTQHIYKEEGHYAIHVTGENEVSQDFSLKMVRINKYMCTSSEVTVDGLGKTVKTALDFFKSQPIKVHAFVKQNCKPKRQSIFQWIMYQMLSNTTYEKDYLYQVILSDTNRNSSYMYFEPATLPYGKYKVILTEYPLDLPDIATVSIGYFRVNPTGLKAYIEGGPMRSAHFGKILLMNASRSLDPDKYGIKHLQIKWECRMENETFESDYETGGCNNSGKLLDMGKPEMYLQTAGFNVGQVLIVRLTLGDVNPPRIAIEQQHIKIKSSASSQCSIRCDHNCNPMGRIIPQLAMKYAAECNVPLRQPLKLNWTLSLKNNQGAYEKYQNFEEITTTGTSGRFLVINDDTLPGGSRFVIRLTVQDADYTEMIGKLDSKPYGGKCSADYTLSLAYETENRFRCEGWMTEGYREDTNPAIDSQQYSELTYYFYYKVKGQEAMYYIGVIKAVTPVTQPVTLRQGMRITEYDIMIIIFIEDMFGSRGKYQFSIKVMPNPKPMSEIAMFQNISLLSPYLESGDIITGMRAGMESLTLMSDWDGGKECQTAWSSLGESYNAPGSGIGASTGSAGNVSDEGKDEWSDGTQKQRMENILSFLESSVPLLENDEDIRSSGETIYTIASNIKKLTDEQKIRSKDILLGMAKKGPQLSDMVSHQDKLTYIKQIMSSLYGTIASAGATSKCNIKDPTFGDIDPIIIEARTKIARQQQQDKCDKQNELARNLSSVINDIRGYVQQTLGTRVPGEKRIAFQTDELYYMTQKVLPMDIFGRVFTAPKSLTPGQSLTEDQQLLDKDGINHIISIQAPGHTIGTHFELPYQTINALENLTDVTVEVIGFIQPFYEYAESADKVNGNVASFSLFSGSTEINLDDLEIPINCLSDNDKIYEAKESGIVSPPVGVEIDDELFYHRINITDVNDTLTIEIKPMRFEDFDQMNFTCYISVNRLPNQTDYEMMKFLPKNQSESGPQNMWSIEIDIDDILMDYIAYTDGNVSASNISNIRIGCTKEGVGKHTFSVYATECLFLDEKGIKKKKWSNKGCKVGKKNTMKTVHCNCDHLTVFSSNTFVPPNTIDFKTVFSKFSDLANNLAVFLTVILILVVYVILVIILRYHDKLDVEKWSVLPLADNTITDLYHYEITTVTGMRKAAGTRSKVYFLLVGSDGESEVRALDDARRKSIPRGSVQHYLCSVPKPLGDLEHIRIWHDNSGKGSRASWYLESVIIKDIQTEISYNFLCGQWLAVDQADGLVERTLPVANEQEMRDFTRLFFTSAKHDMTDGHIWFSIVSRPNRSTFTRVQRLSCCLSLLYTTMIANAMFYRADEQATNGQAIKLGPFVFTLTQLYISVVSSMVVIPVSLLVITTFRKARPKTKKKVPVDNTTIETKDNWREDIRNKWGQWGYYDGLFMLMKQDEVAQMHDICARPKSAESADSQSTLVEEFNKDNDQIIQDKKATKKGSSSTMWPHWVIYIGWVLVFLSVMGSAFFVILYSMEWGSERSEEWLSAFFLSFFESVIIIQPLKVVVLSFLLTLIFRKSPNEEDINKTIGGDEQPVLVYHRQHRYNHVWQYPEHRKPYKVDEEYYRNIEKMKILRLRELRAYAVTREVFVYILYLIIISVLCYDNKDTNAFRCINQINNNFIYPTHGFAYADTKAKFFNWAEQVFVPNMYSKNWYNGQDQYWRLKYYINDKVNVRVGPPRFRQVRVEPADCNFPTIFTQHKVIRNCYNSLTASNYDDKSYLEGWVTPDNASQVATGESPWRYRSTLELKTIPFIGSLATYAGGGYVMNLGNTDQSAYDAIAELKNTSWMDHQTRAVFVDFNLYNPGINLFTMGSLLIEYPASGGGIPFLYRSKTVRLYAYVGDKFIIRVALELVFLLFTLYYLIAQFKLMKKLRGKYFQGFWNYWELINISSFIAACVLYASHKIVSTITLNEFHKNPDKYISFDATSFWDEILGYTMSVMLFTAMVKLLKILRFNKHIGRLSILLRRATQPLSSYGLVFIFMFLGFSHFAYLLLGSQMLSYATFISSLESQFSMMLMSFDFDAIRRADGIFGPLFFLLFIVFVVIFMTNMLVSIINEVFEDASGQGQSEDDHQIVEFILGKLKSLLDISNWFQTDEDDDDEIKGKRNAETQTTFIKHGWMDIYSISGIWNKKENQTC